MKTVLLAALVAASLGGCASTTMSNLTSGVSGTVPITLTDAQVKLVQDTVRASLKDPTSPIFGITGGSRAPDGTTYACGIVNAKNSFGGYVGDTPYAGMLHGNSYELVAMGGAENDTEIAGQMCKRYGINLPGW